MEVSLDSLQVVFAEALVSNGKTFTALPDGRLPPNNATVRDYSHVVDNADGVESSVKSFLQHFASSLPEGCAVYAYRMQLHPTDDGKYFFNVPCAVLHAE
jgi:hypothetical protein